MHNACVRLTRNLTALLATNPKTHELLFLYVQTAIKGYTATFNKLKYY